MKKCQVFGRERSNLIFSTLSLRELLFHPAGLSRSLLRREADLRNISILVLRRECAHPGRFLGEGRKTSDGSGAGRRGNSGEKASLGDWETQGRHFNMVEVFNRDKKGFRENGEDDVGEKP